MKVLVCGSRDWVAFERIEAVLDSLQGAKGGIECIVTGGCRGADTDAHLWALKRNIEAKVYRSDWDQHGKAAGPMRNQKMLSVERPDLVVAFGSSGPGTKNMLKQAKRYGFETMVFEQ